MVCYIYLEYERCDGGVDDLVRETRFLETFRFLRRLRPLSAHAEDPGNDARLLAAAHLRVSVEHRAHQRRPAARHAPYEYQRHGLVVGEVAVLRVVDILDGVPRHHPRVVAAARLQPAVVERQDRNDGHDQQELAREALHRHGYDVSGASGWRPRPVSWCRQCVRRSFPCGRQMNIL